jgi:hypothetical protein
MNESEKLVDKVYEQVCDMDSEDDIEIDEGDNE